MIPLQPAHYAGSVDFDNEKGEWQDATFTAPSLDILCEKMLKFMKRRKNSDVFFAAYVNINGKEKDITSIVKERVYAL